MAVALRGRAAIRTALATPGALPRDDGAALAAVARRGHATAVEIGRRRRLIREPLVDQRLHLLDGIGVHLVEPRREGR